MFSLQSFWVSWTQSQNRQAVNDADRQQAGETPIAWSKWLSVFACLFLYTMRLTARLNCEELHIPTLLSASPLHRRRPVSRAFSQSNGPAEERRTRKSQRERIWPQLLALCALAFAIRFIVVLCVYRGLPASDQHESFGWEQGWIARSLVLHHGFSSPFQPLDDVPTALVAPLYPALLAGIFRIFGLYTPASALVALGLNALISASVVLPVFLLARRATDLTYAMHHPGRTVRTGPSAPAHETWLYRTPWIAAALWTLYPFSIFYSGSYLWDCTLTGALFAWVFLLSLDLHRRGIVGWVSWGSLCGATALCNPCILPMCLVLMAWQAVRGRARIGPATLRAVAAAGTIALILLPWTLRNLRVLHTAAPMRDGFWLEFYAGNSGDTAHSNPAWAHPASNPVELQRYEQLGEIAYMREKQGLALRNVQAHPGDFAVSTARRVERFWTGYWSLSKTYLAQEPLDLPNVPFCTVLTGLMLLGGGGLVRRRSSALFAFWALLLVFPLPYYLTHASMDYRQPIEPEVVVLVGVGIADLGRRRANRLALREHKEAAVMAAA